MTKAQETKARRAAVLAILGAGWKGEKGSEGARDAYRKRQGRLEVSVHPWRTVDGNFYVGAYEHGKRGALGFQFFQTVEQAAAAANKYFTA